MAASLFNGKRAFSWSPDQYLPPFEAMGREEAPVAPTASQYFDAIAGTVTSTLVPRATLSSSVIRALDRLFLIEKGYGKNLFGGYAIDAAGRIVIEVPHITGEQMRTLAAHGDKNRDYSPEYGKVQIFYNPAGGGFIGANIKPDGTREKLSFDESETSFYMAVILKCLHSDPLNEIQPYWDSFLEYTEEAQHHDLHPDIEDTLELAACMISDNVYRRVRYCEEIEKAVPGAGIKARVNSVPLLELKHLSKFDPVIGAGTVEGLKTVKATPVAEEPILPETTSSVLELKGKFALSEREYTEEEKALIPDIPERYQIPDEVIEVCDFIKRSSSMPVPFRNFVFCGPAGSGKTEAVKMVAYALNKPLVTQACGPYTQGVDLSTQAIPNPDGSGNYVFSCAPMMTGIKKGYVTEISEADQMLKDGVLKEFNPLFDGTGKMQLVTGELLVRDPEAVVIYTCNCYEKDLEPSVKNRCLVYEFNTPDDEVLVERVVAESGYNNKDAVRQMVDVYHRISDYITENCVAGEVGVRNLVAWASMTALNGRPWHNAKRSMVCHPSASPDEKAEIRQALMSCVEVQFPPEEVNLPW